VYLPVVLADGVDLLGKKILMGKISVQGIWRLLILCGL
jgi:hypothetical protein